MSTIPELQTKLATLAELRDEKALQKAVLDDIAADYEQLRLDVLADLTELKIKGLKGERLSVSRKEKKSITITDARAVSSWLTDQGFDLDEYTILNETRVKPILEARLKEDGEIPDGVTTSVNEYIAITVHKKEEPTNE